MKNTFGRQPRALRLLSLALLAGGGLIAAGCGGQSQASKATQLLNGGVAAQNSGNLALAASDFSQLVAIEPKNRTALYDLGLVEQLQGQTSSAETHYQAAIAVDPTFVPALYNLATAVSSSAPTEAENLYEQVLNLSPNDADAWLNLGYVLRGLGQTTKGNADITKAISIDPSLSSHAPAGLHSTKKK